MGGWWWSRWGARLARGPGMTDTKQDTRNPAAGELEEAEGLAFVFLTLSNHRGVPDRGPGCLTAGTPNLCSGATRPGLGPVPYTLHVAVIQCLRLCPRAACKPSPAAGAFIICNKAPPHPLAGPPPPSTWSRPVGWLYCNGKGPIWSPEMHPRFPPGPRSS